MSDIVERLNLVAARAPLQSETQYAANDAIAEIERLRGEKKTWVRIADARAIQVATLRAAMTKARASVQADYDSLLESGCLLDDERCPIRETMDGEMEEYAKEYEAVLAGIDSALSATPVTGQPEGTAQPEAGRGAAETGRRNGARHHRDDIEDQDDADFEAWRSDR